MTMQDWVSEARFWLSHVREAVTAGGYTGPICTAGGFCRDTLMGRPAKDLDIFVEDDGRDWSEIANRIVSSFPCGAARITNIVSTAYREWSEDVAIVYQISIHEGRKAIMFPVGYPFSSIDFIVMRNSAEYGYTTDQQFLKDIVGRVDLRINAVGVSMHHSKVNEWFDHDLVNGKLVVQASRVNPEDRPRQQRRLDRLTAEKFQGWTHWEERPDGTLVPWERGDV